MRLKSLVLFFFWDDFSLANLFHGKLYAFTMVCANLCNFCRCPDSIHDIIQIEVINFVAFMQKIDNTHSTYLHAYVKILPSALVLHMVNVTLAPSYYGIQLYIHNRDNDPLPPSLAPPIA